MPTTNPQASYVVDCECLVDASQTSNNSGRALMIELLEDSSAGVPTAVIKELRNAFEDEFADLDPHIKRRVLLKPAHRARAGAIASKANSGFRIKAYGGESDWIVAAVALTEGCTVITVKKKKDFYASTAGCKVVTLEELQILL